ncbi:MAG: hypothetical protein NC342_07630 [Pseudoflavonifractor sp.]|nr:hypothetical protein [Alloprevotella sp.]MCM1117390.1 hypothetical protein [Pseudoflavonifractor sp.]
MAIIKSAEQRELSALEKVEKEIRRHHKMERLQRFALCTLGLLAIGAFFTGRCLK